MSSQTCLKLLLVDDNLNDALNLTEALSGCRALTCESDLAASWEEAEIFIKRVCYDIYIFDSSLFESDSKLAQHVRELGYSAPIILLADDENLDFSSMLRRFGIDDYLVRNQFNSALLERTLLYAIERRHHIEELRSAQMRGSLLLSAITHTSAGVVVTDPNQPDNPIIFANPGFCQMTGYKREEILGRNCRFLAGPRSDTLVIARLREAIAQRRDFNGTLLNYRKDGTTFWNDLKVNPIFNAEGQLSYFIGMQTDVTQHVESQSLKNRLAAILESSADAIYSCNFDGIVTAWNRGGEELFEYSAEEMIGRSIFELMPPEMAKAVKDTQTQVKKGKSVVDAQSLGFSKSGQSKHISLSLAPIRDEKGEVAEIAVVARDISQSKRHEQELEASNKRITDIWESINDGFFALNGEGRFTYVNKRAALLLQQNSDIVGEKIWDVFPEEATTGFHQKYLEVMNTRRPAHFEEYYETLSCWLEVHAYPSKEGIAVYFRDVSERRHAQNSIEELNAQLQQRVERLSALHEIDIAISGSFDLKMTLSISLSHLMQQLDVDAARVWLLCDNTLMLEAVAQLGFHHHEKPTPRLRLGEGLAGQIAFERCALAVTSDPAASDPAASHNIPTYSVLSSTRYSDKQSEIPEGFAFYYGMPLSAKGTLLGVLEVLRKKPFSPDADWISFMETLAAQATIAIDNSLLFSQLQFSNNELFLAYDTTIEGWSRALDLRDKETEGHSLRVTELTMRLADAIGVPKSELPHVRRGALLHDIGKMGIPDDILLKPGALTEEEWIIMKRHPVYAFELLSPIDFLRPALDIPYCHHEKWDGSGYPRGLRGEHIPLSARLFAVVDVWDALTSDRPYRAAWTQERALEYIVQQAGTHFDPKIVEVFLQHVR